MSEIDEQGPFPPAHYRVSAKALIKNDKGEVLCVKEDYNNWELPGGGINFDEDFMASLRRELSEEIGLVCGFETDFLGVESLYVPARKAYVMKIIFQVRPENFDFKAGSDVTEIKFIDPKTFEKDPVGDEFMVYKYGC